MSGGHALTSTLAAGLRLDPRPPFPARPWSSELPGSERGRRCGAVPPASWLAGYGTGSRVSPECPLHPSDLLSRPLSSQRGQMGALNCADAGLGITFYFGVRVQSSHLFWGVSNTAHSPSGVGGWGRGLTHIRSLESSRRTWLRISAFRDPNTGAQSGSAAIALGRIRSKGGEEAPEVALPLGKRARWVCGWWRQPSGSCTERPGCRTRNQQNCESKPISYDNTYKWTGYSKC